MGKREDESDLRMCRIDGRKPTMREKWTAFHRLWRIANGHGAYRDMDAGIAFRVLFPSWRWVQLLDGPESDGLVNRSHIPKSLRRQLLDGIRRRRLRASGGSVERDRDVARRVRDQHGMEVTPDEVAEVRHKVMGMARKVSDDLGLPRPVHIDEVLAVMRGESR